MFNSLGANRNDRFGRGLRIFRANPRLEQANIKGLLRQLEQDAATTMPPRRRGKHNRRSHPRLQYHQCNVAIIVEHPGGGTAQFLVCTRNLSAGGLALLHGGFLHPGTRCTLGLPQVRGEPCAVIGKVVACRAVDGFIHEVGIKFEHLIDPNLFVEPETPVGQREISPGELRQARQHQIQLRAGQALVELQSVIDPPDLEKARAICTRVRAEAIALDAPSLMCAAADTLHVLETTASVARAVTELRELIDLCRTLSQRS